MAGAIRKTMVYLGLADGDENYQSVQSAPVGQADRDYNPPTSPTPRVNHAQAADDYRAQVTPIKHAPSAREQGVDLRQINTIHPRSYNDAKSIGESFRNGIPVIMNVTDMGEGDAKRLVDFSAGLVFGLHGSIERVTNKVFLLSPAFVEVLGESKNEEDKPAAFFNQS